jgi:hypothetical protein
VECLDQYLASPAFARFGEAVARRVELAEMRLSANPLPALVADLEMAILTEAHRALAALPGLVDNKKQGPLSQAESWFWL